ncbi:hypothetical protein ABI59_03075 [Acidobacteria bacterium Mor1]|nr:hypothetical protein ABI59_03075 [Acidobacteria bacterium Mor1]
MLRRLLWGVAALLVVCLTSLFLLRDRLDGWVRDRIQHEIEQALPDARVSLDRVDIGFYGPRLDFHGFSLELDGLPDRISFEKARIRPKLSGFGGLLARRIHLSEVTIQRPDVVLTAEGLARLGAGPSEEGSEPAEFPDLRIRRFDVSQGAFTYEDRSIPLTLELTDLDLDARGRVLADGGRGGVRLSATVLHSPIERPLPLKIRAELNYSGQRLQLSGLHAEGDGVRLDGNAVLFLSDPFRVRGETQVQADLATIAPVLDEAWRDLRGRVEGPLSWSYADGEGFRLDGELVGQRVRYGDLSASRLSTRLEITPGRLRFGELDLDAWDGSVRGELELALDGPIRFEADVEGRGLDAHSLGSLAGLPLPFAARADAVARLSGLVDRRSTWRGGGSATFQGDPDDAQPIPLDGAGDFTIVDGVLSASAPAVQAAGAALSFGLEADLGGDGRGWVELDGETSNAASTHRATLAVLESLDVEIPADLRRPITGRGPLDVRVGFGGEPDAGGGRVDLGLEFTAGSLDGTAFDRLSLDLALAGDQLKIESLDAEAPDWQLRGALSYDLSNDTIERLEGEAEEVQLPVLLGLIPEAPAVEGTLSGSLLLAGPLNRLTGEGRVAISELRWEGEYLERLESPVRVLDGAWTLPELTAAGPAIRLGGQVAFAPDGDRIEIELRDTSLQLDALSALQGAGVEGTLDLDGRLQLSGGSSTGEIGVEARGLIASGIDLGSASGVIRPESERVVAELNAPRRSARAQATLGLGSDLPLEVQVQLDGSDFDLIDQDGYGGAWVRLDGELRYAAALGETRPADLAGVFSGIELHLGSRVLRSGEPCQAHLDGDRLSVGPMRLEGDGTALELALLYEFGSAALDGYGRGNLDLGAAAALVPELRAAGPVDVDLRLSGTGEAPRLDGSLSLEGGRLRLLGFPHTLEQTSARIEFGGDTARLERLEGILGSGEVTGSGEARLEGLALGDHRFELSARSLRIRFPDEFRGIYDGELVLGGDADQSTLSGTVNVLRGIYSQDFELFSLLGVGTREVAASDEGLLPDVGLDIRLVARDGIWMKNDLADVESRFDLRLGGDLNRPELSGRLTLLEGGELRFRDVDYTITSGSLDFVELDSWLPEIEMRAETTVREYAVFLRISGTVDQFEYELTSSPDLSQQDIIALLTTGKTMQELSAESGGSGFTGDLAANYFAGALTGTFSKQLQRLLAVERLRIDPLLAQEDAEPTARVTIGKEVADDLFLIYSTDIGAEERQLYQVEWQASRKMRVIAERDVTGALGGDVRFRERFWWKRPASAPRAKKKSGASEAGADGKETVQVASVRFEGIGDDAAAELRKKLSIARGTPYRRSVAIEGAEAIRRYYAGQARIEAEVGWRTEGPEDRPTVVYSIVPGRVTEVVLAGIDRKHEKRIRELLEDHWVESIIGEDLLDDAAEIIRDYFQERGFYTVDVSVDETLDDGLHRVEFVIDTGKTVRIRSVEIEGAEAIDEDRLRRQFLTGRRTLLQRSAILPRVLREDLAALRTLYRNEGFLEVLIDQPRVRLSAEADRADVTIRIEEGPRFYIRTLEFENPDGELPYSRAELLEWSGLATGKVYSPPELLEAESRLRSALDSRGYPTARARGRVELGEAEARIRFTIRPGQQLRIQEVALRGNDLTKDRIIKGELELEEGDLISRDTLLRNQHRLYRLGIFRSVDVGYEPVDGGEPGQQRVVVDIEEAQPLSLTVGAGFDSEAGLRGNLALSHDNIGGWDRTAGFQASVSDLQRRGQVTFGEPRLFGFDLPTVVSLGQSDTEENDFTVKRRSVGVRIDHRLSPRWNAFGRYAFQRVDLRDVVDPLRVQEEKLEDVVLGDVSYGLLLDSRDDPFLPTQGQYATMEVQLFAEPFGSEQEFLKGFFQNTYTHTFGNGHTFATAIRVGFARRLGATTRVPLSERFFAGGDSTLRGFDRDTVGPRIGDVAAGGEGLLLLNQEWRVPLWGRLKGVLFYDAGNVFDRAGDIDPFDLRHVLGLGVRLETPIGPLRLEYGSKLDRVGDESRGELFIAIGSAF